MTANIPAIQNRIVAVIHGRNDGTLIEVRPYEAPYDGQVFRQGGSIDTRPAWPDEYALPLPKSPSVPFFREHPLLATFPV